LNSIGQKVLVLYWQYFFHKVLDYIGIGSTFWSSYWYWYRHSV